MKEPKKIMSIKQKMEELKKIMFIKRPSLSDLSEQYLLKTRRIFLWGEIEDITAVKIVKAMRILVKKKTKAPLYLYIHSAGGCTAAADMIINDIVGLVEQNVEVNTIATGQACSAAAEILVMGTPGRRFAMPFTTIMFHPSSYGLEQDYSGNQERFATFIKKQDDKKLKIVAEACGFREGSKKYREFEQEVQKGLWLTPKDAIKWGAIDQIWDYSWEREIDTQIYD